MVNLIGLIAVFLCLFSSLSARARPTICEYLDLKNCDNTARAMSRSSSASFPSSVSAAMNNPSSLSMEKGFGLETIFYRGKGRLGIASGTGRVGAAVTVASAQETFFSHYALEAPNSYRARRSETQVFEREDDVSLAAAANLFGKRKRRGFQLDIGGIYKRNGEKESNHFGGGATLSFNKVLSVGYSSYSDVLYEDYRNKSIHTYNTQGERSAYPTYYSNNEANVVDIETKTETLNLGLKFGNLALDHTTISTTFEDDQLDPSHIKILSAAMFHKKWIFTAAQRTEESYRESYRDGRFIQEKRKRALFFGAQRSIGSYALLGLFHNYYLLNDISFGLSVFL